MFKVGDRVRVTENMNNVVIGDTGRVMGTINNGMLCVEFDRNINGHDGRMDGCKGGKDDHCKFLDKKYLELIKEATPMINTTARDSVADALRECRERYAKLFDTAIGAIAKAEKPEEVMAAKKRLLKGLVDNMPLKSDACYFCKIHFTPGEWKCDAANCEYAKTHGNCNEDGSTWRKIQEAKDTLEAVLNSYYSGETYTDPEREKRFVEYKRLKAEFEPA